MPTPARGPQTTRRTRASSTEKKRAPPPRRHIHSHPAPCRAERSTLLDCRPLHRTAPSPVFLGRRPHARLVHVDNDWMAEPQVQAQCSIVISDSRQPRCRGRRGRREPRFRCSRAVLLCMRTRSPDRRLGAHPHWWLAAADTRSWASVGSHGTFPATSVGTCLVRRRMFGLGCAN